MQKCFSLALPIEDNDNDKDGDDEEEEKEVHLQSVVKQLVILEPHVKGQLPTALQKGSTFRKGLTFENV